jgi:hypothetical protein
MISVSRAADRPYRLDARAERPAATKPPLLKRLLRIAWRATHM